MKLCFLDRDGVINQDSKDYIKSPEEWQPIPRALEAIAYLKQQGWTVAVLTNQSGLGRGYYNHSTLSGIHAKMNAALAELGCCIDWISYSPYLDHHQSKCRKPETGLLEITARYFQTNTQGVPFIGDSWRDLQAGLAADARPVLVRTGNGEKTLAARKDDLTRHAIPVYDDLWSAAQAI